MSEEISKIDKLDKVDILSPTASPKIREFFGAIIKINDLGIFHEASCKLCNNKLRFEAEDTYSKLPQYEQNKYIKVKEFLESKGEKIPLDVIKNHCNQHVNQGESQLRKIEYIETLDNLSSIKLSTLEECDLMLNALKERMLETAKLIPDSKNSKLDIERAKSEIIVQISKAESNLLQLRAKLLGEMIENGEVIIIPRSKFKQVFNDALNSVKNEEEKNILVGLLKNLSKVEDRSSNK